MSNCERHRASLRLCEEIMDLILAIEREPRAWIRRELTDRLEVTRGQLARIHRLNRDEISRQRRVGGAGRKRKRKRK